MPTVRSAQNFQENSCLRVLPRSTRAAREELDPRTHSSAVRIESASVGSKVFAASPTTSGRALLPLYLTRSATPDREIVDLSSAAKLPPPKQSRKKFSRSHFDSAYARRKAPK